MLWLVLSIAIPYLLVRWEYEAEATGLFFPHQPVIGVIVAAIAALCGLWAAIVLAVHDGGSPLPFDRPRRLVVAGPYAWLRNPLVTATMWIAIGVALYAGATLVLFYVGILALLWHVLVRPAEDTELQRLFGREFEAYQRAVRFWLPMRRRWAPVTTSRPISLDETPLPGRPRRRVG